MVILGLGSNQGDRLFYLRAALNLIKKIPDLTVERVSPVYISDALLLENSPHSWDTPYLNLGLRCETTLAPLALLEQTKKIETQLGRQRLHAWAPRPIDIDILAWDDRVLYDEKLHIPHEHLPTRPFALWPLADLAPRWIYPLQNHFFGKTATEIAAQWPSRFNGDAPLHTRQIAQRIDTSQLMGIMNVTPDSFSDGGMLTESTTTKQAYDLVAAGADILDIGAEATGPRAKAIDATVEWQRLKPHLQSVLQARQQMDVPPKISVDTRHFQVAKKALALGVDWINDVSGLTDPNMREVISAAQCDVIIMHHLTIPQNNAVFLPLDKNPVELVYAWAESQLCQLEKNGIARQRVIVDIGIGFGKTPAQSLELLQQITQFQQLDCRLLVGHSRKSFLTLFNDITPKERDIETLPVSLYLSLQGVDYLRLHNVAMCARALKIAAAL
jgi:2-amino-4-hydroxy-6-hydroxymethyldihydropteridine diphosphokinase/dihydropteroate synthase